MFTIYLIIHSMDRRGRRRLRPLRRDPGVPRGVRAVYEFLLLLLVLLLLLLLVVVVIIGGLRLLIKVYVYIYIYVLHTIYYDTIALY